jgi:hypothetical protein
VAIARSSSTVPRAMICPLRMMLIRSHISCATSSVWVLMRIGDAARAHAAEDVLDQARAARVEADHRLVHEHGARAMEERRRT